MKTQHIQKGNIVNVIKTEHTSKNVRWAKETNILEIPFTKAKISKKMIEEIVNMFGYCESTLTRLSRRKQKINVSELISTIEAFNI